MTRMRINGGQAGVMGRREKRGRRRRRGKRERRGGKMGKKWDKPP